MRSFTFVQDDKLAKEISYGTTAILLLFFYAEPNPIFVANIGNNFRIIPVRDYFLLNIAAVLTSRSNSKNKTGTDKITANSRSSSGKGQMLFERCSSCCCYCVKSEFFCPRWLNEKLFASNNRRTKDVACDS